MQDNHYNQDTSRKGDTRVGNLDTQGSQDNLGTADSDRAVFPEVGIPAIVVARGMQDFVEVSVVNKAREKQVEIAARLMGIQGAHQ